jgi:hypothetical protein
MFFQNIILGATISGIIGSLLIVPAVVKSVREKIHESNLPVLVDVKPNWWPGLTHRELFFVGLFVHVVLCVLFGLIYVILVEQSWLFITRMAYSLISLIVYALCAWVVTGAIVFPLIGFGFFGRKENGAVWAEVLGTYLLLGVSMWLVVQWFQPAYFNAL